MIAQIETQHHAALLEMNAEFVHWLSPLDAQTLDYILARASYARQIGNGAGVLIGYAYDVHYPDHKNLTWLGGRLSNFFYIDRIIISRAAQGKGYGRKLYEDAAAFAASGGYSALACEVNTRPDNPGSHKFHLSQGFETIGEQEFPDFNKSVRYYAKAL